MNETMSKGKWNQFKGSSKKRWSEITDDDLDMIEGDVKKNSVRIQDKHGKSKTRKSENFDREQ